MLISRFYAMPGPEEGGVLSEYCYYIGSEGALTGHEVTVLEYLFGDTRYPEKNRWSGSFLDICSSVVEIGPRLNVETDFSSTIVSALNILGLNNVVRVERSRRYGFWCPTTQEQLEEFAAKRFDRMVEMVYLTALESFDCGLERAETEIVPVLERGQAAIDEVQRRLEFSLGDVGSDFYLQLFQKILQRNPTDSELGVIGNGLCDHSRHLTFGSRRVIDGRILEASLFDLVRRPAQRNPEGILSAFGPNCSAAVGDVVINLVPERVGLPGSLVFSRGLHHHTIKIESHNHPSFVEPFQGAATGVGGILRDLFRDEVAALGIGYCVANLNDHDGWRQPQFGASPTDILIRASDGGSWYGNCFGRPTIVGICRSFGLELPEGYRAWFKPIVVVAGVGIVHEDTPENKLETGMLVVLLGGPSRRIGVGGAAGSSLDAGQSASELDWNSVQRGAPEVENRLARVFRACMHLGRNTPIAALNDLGAGGIGNAVTELVFPLGAELDLNRVPQADPTLSDRENVTNEAQERMAVCVRPQNLPGLQAICEREGVNCAVIGEVTGTGRIVMKSGGRAVVDLPLQETFGVDLSKREVMWSRVDRHRVAPNLPESAQFSDVLKSVLGHANVGSKAFLTRKVDRSVGGRVCQQQACGPFDVPLCGFGMVADGFFQDSGRALAFGEQPIAGLVSHEAMVRLAVAEALLNLSGACTNGMSSITMVASWMWATRYLGEGALLSDAVTALSEFVGRIIGGKDSLSMVARGCTSPSGTQTDVAAPGQLIIFAQAKVPDVRVKATPDLKQQFNSLVYIPVNPGKTRLGGSVLLQTLGQIGKECPDVDLPDALCNVFRAVQELVFSGLAESVHDVSDGGVVSAVLEMAFAGGRGVSVEFAANSGLYPDAFNQEPAVIVETSRPDEVCGALSRHRLSGVVIGRVGGYHAEISIRHGGELCYLGEFTDLRMAWETPSYRFERLQTNHSCVESELASIRNQKAPPEHRLGFSPVAVDLKKLAAKASKPKVAVLRTFGSNSDEEMAAAAFCAGFEPHDVAMSDLVQGRVTDFDEYQGLLVVGGFANGDVPFAARSWASIIRFRPEVRAIFDRFFARTDTFSFWECNGCQLFSNLDWLAFPGLSPADRPRFVRNVSGRFESRWLWVRIIASPASKVMLADMDGSVLPVWVDHGEGLLDASRSVAQQLLLRRLIPVRFTMPNLEPADTEDYPYNPNGSPFGIAGICSPCGRHLAMMPHPSRAFLSWQAQWLPPDWTRLPVGVWLKMFQNAHDWCLRHR